MSKGPTVPQIINKKIKKKKKKDLIQLFNTEAFK